jgi:hypothetical protein
VEKFLRIIGWVGVIVGLSGVLPGIFLLRGSMIEFGVINLLLGGLVLYQGALLDELRHIRRGIARMAGKAERSLEEVER